MRHGVDCLQFARDRTEASGAFPMQQNLLLPARSAVVGCVSFVCTHSTKGSLSHVGEIDRASLVQARPGRWTA